MSRPAPEFSRLVPLARLGSGGFCQQIRASEAERARLARRFDLLDLDRLEATVELRRRTDQSVLLTATFEAEFSQSCIVTLEPVAGAAAGGFSLIYGAPDVPEPTAEAAIDEPAFEPLDGDAIDIGEAVAQELSLSLPEFPRLPEAALAEAMAAQAPSAAEAETEPADGRLAGLAAWRRPQRG